MTSRQKTRPLQHESLNSERDRFSRRNTKIGPLQAYSVQVSEPEAILTQKLVATRVHPAVMWLDRDFSLVL